MKRIHIVGSGPRTGTTLLTELIKVCFQIDYANEHETSISISNHRFGKSGIILSKQPSEIKIVKYPLILDKNLYVICIIRDPRDMVVSYHGSEPNIYWCSLRYWQLFLKYYNKLKNHKRFIMIKYEDLVTNPNEVQSFIKKKLNFLNVKHQFSDYHVYANPSEDSVRAMKKFRPIEAKGIGHWLNNLERIKQQIDVHGNISDSLIKFKYEKNDEWMSILKNVEKKNFKTKTGEFFSKKELRKRNRKKWIATFNILLEKIHLNPELIIAPIINFYNNHIKNKKAF